MNWLIEAETFMPDIFVAGAVSADGKVMDEIRNHVMVRDLGQGVPEHLIVNYARERMPIHSVMRVIDIMQQSKMIVAIAHDPKTGQRLFKAVK